MTDRLRVVDIVAGTTVDGPGFRTSIYFAGCIHKCQGCHNPQTWPMDSGRDMSIDEIMEIVVKNDFDVTFSGGDPLLQAKALIPLATKIKELGKTIWCYTGYEYENIIGDADIRGLLQFVDVVVDGPFMEKHADISLLFRGSSNQRLIDVRLSMENNNVILWESDF